MCGFCRKTIQSVTASFDFRRVLLDFFLTDTRGRLLPLMAACSLPDKLPAKGTSLEPLLRGTVLSYRTISSPMARRPESPYSAFDLFWPTEGSRNNIQQVLTMTSRGYAHFHSLLVTFSHHVMQPGLADCHVDPPPSSQPSPRQGTS